jgi:WD40 repeat protein
MIGDSSEPWAVLGNHLGSVQSLHYDSYKVITGGTADRHVHVWSAETGDEISSLDSTISASSNDTGVSAFVANGGRLVTGTCGEDPGFVRLQDFTNCVNPLVDVNTNSSFENHSSKFWESIPEDAS